MNVHERNYGIHDQELLAIVESFREWRHYLEGSSQPIEVITDHDSLRYFQGRKPLSRRQVCWAQDLAAYWFQVKYREGSRTQQMGLRGDLITFARRTMRIIWSLGSATHTRWHRFWDSLRRLQACDRSFAMGLSLADEEAVFCEDPSQKLLEHVCEYYENDRPARQRLLAAKAAGIGSSGKINGQWELREERLYQGERLYIPDVHHLRLGILAKCHDDPLAGHIKIM